MSDGAVAVVLGLSDQVADGCICDSSYARNVFTLFWVFNVLWGTCSVQEELLVAVGRAEALVPSLAMTTTERCSSAWSQSLKYIGAVQCS